MKKIFLKISLITLFVSFIGQGCDKEKEDLSYLDIKKPLSTPPGFAIYKTKKDYFYNVNLWTSNTGEIEGCQEFVDNDSRVTVFKGKYYYNLRYRLNDNYILSYEVKENDCFTSITYDAYVREKMSQRYHDGLIIPHLTENIIDKDPFTEFYFYKGDEYNGFTIDEINQLIKDNNLQKYFTKLK